jgi:hypothetical protein
MIVEQAKTQLRVVVPIEEEEDGNTKLQVPVAVRSNA